MLSHMILFRAAMASSTAAGVGTLPAPQSRGWMASMLQGIRAQADDGETDARAEHRDAPRGRRRGRGDLEL